MIPFCRGGGIEIRGLTARSIPKKKILTEPVIEKYQFVPHFDMGEKDVCLYTIIQNIFILVLVCNVKPFVVAFSNRTYQRSTDIGSEKRSESEIGRISSTQYKAFHHRDGERIR